MMYAAVTTHVPALAIQTKVKLKCSDASIEITILQTISTIPPIIGNTA